MENSNDNGQGVSAHNRMENDALAPAYSPGDKPDSVVVTLKQPKSDAPWILGIIAFVASIPNILCATVCAAVSTGVAGGMAGVATEEAAKGNQDAAVASSVAAGAGATIVGMLVAFVIVSVLCFFLTFLGKSKYCVSSGVALILGSLFILFNSYVGLGNILWGTVAGVCYLIAGAYSIVNNKRVA